ncbi:2,3-butanediol dehydrogenase [Jonesiaceae bacterium BS-20]|uniref:2,3-butanediol dehydrogenase n=1 Tax=Jonesiaceae bacterium BS-20 TaxID=3120821 RepID=A0AAU7DVN3_9MICO
MKAIRYYGKEDVRLDEIDEPQVRPGTVKIKPAWTGVCGSDLHLYFDGVMPPAPSATEPHPATHETLPVGFGHEFSGTVIEVGEGVTRLAVGDNVAVEPLLVCDECPACKSGNYNICAKMGFIGISGGGGGMSEAVIVGERWAHKVGDMPLDEAALIEPLAVAVHAARRVDVKAGEVALIGGAGPIGLLTAAVLKTRGIITIVSEVSQARRDIAKQLGVADHLINPMEQDVIETVYGLTEGAGAAAAFDCAGVQPVFDALLGSLRARGHLQVVALYTESPKLNYPVMLYKEAMITASQGYAHSYPEAIELVASGKIDLAPYITARVSADNIATEGYEFLQNNKETQVKVIAKMD